ncbi:protein-disulfide reductase DsbD [Undibacterium sp. 5I1]|nr:MULTISPECIES: protein-disulfide reductase DsbD [unclassified Undibacterium]MDY7539267.1 protein-disulfide reductase DsbD [Undibacterium sp. 5I1]MEB0231716.1 protein-disulfide reductase DsbD [Undibacterium sp. 10I3]MEB0256934.1 protein-disulfide reductase DsbD [Undibacterium sp. 5I1]
MILLFFGFSSVAVADDFLDPEVAFKVSGKMIEPGVAEINFNIADGYYLYRERFKFASDNAKLGDVVIPKGKVKFDETFQKEVETYRHSLVVKVPVQASGDFTLKVTSQGCADQGLCYPPQDALIKLSIADAPAKSDVANTADDHSADTEIHSISAALKSGKLIVILPLFLLLGLGLSFTPCVLPMVPILSFIIVGEGTSVRRSRGFLLSLVYSLGMALVYTALGIGAGLVGEGLAATLQNPWVLGTFALLMVVLSLSMFGVYQLQVPAALQTKLTVASEGQRNGKLFGVFVMGAISALIVGPCVAAPLAGALVYISQTRDVVVGGFALFAMAIGMSVPLLLVGLSAGSLLPRAGAWMESIKRFFGVLMLAMALWMVSPVIPVWVQMIAWAVLVLGYAIFLLFLHKGNLYSKGFAVIFAVLGLIQLVGVLTGGRDVFAPLSHLTGSEKHGVTFTRVRSVAELDAALAQSKGKAALLDFYADWCVSCKEMEKLTFTDDKVKAKMDQMLLLQVDVTANNADDKVLLKRFGLFGPPGIIFFNQRGEEITGGRVIGYQNAEKFLKSITAFEASR